jgi:maleylpyruvate isomerase
VSDQYAVPSGAYLGWLREGTELMHSAARQAEDLGIPSGLPGWSGRHLVTHVARNADALGNLLHWARTGVETPMYAAPQQRIADIEAGALRQDGQIRADLEASSARLEAAIAGMPRTCWQVIVRTARGRQVAVAEAVWMRIREVWVHSLDLRVGVTADAFPDALVGELLDEVARDLGRKDGCPLLLLQASGGSWQLGPGRAAQVVSGRPTSLLTWLTGRSRGADLASAQPLPALPDWL